MNDLFEDLTTINESVGEFNPLDFIIDIDGYLEKNPPKEFEYDLDDFTQENLAANPNMEWLNFVKCHLFSPVSDNIDDQRKQLDELKQKLKSEATYLTHGFCPGAFPKDFNEPVLALDTETTGLDTRCMYNYYGNLIVHTKLVGLCLAVLDDEGYYLPINHTGSDYILNWDFTLIVSFINELHNEFFTVYHNAPYDREILAMNGISHFRRWPYFCDTQLLDFFNDVNNKLHGLKLASERLLGRKMIEIKQLFYQNTKKVKKGMNISFDRIPAKTAYVYGSCDAMNTLGLFKYYASKRQEDNIFFNQPIPLTIDHKCTDVLRNLARAGAPVDFDYYLYAAKDIEYRIMLLEEEIFNYVGRRFDIGSPDQVSDLLYDEYNIPVLEGEERNKKGKFSTKEEVLDKLYEKHPEYKILQYVVTYRKLIGTTKKFYLKAVINSYVDALLPYTKVQIQYSQTVIPTSRFSSASNSGRSRVIVKTTKTGNLTYNYYQGSGDCGFNSQGINDPHYILKKAKKIKKINPESGVNVLSPYPNTVIERFIKRAVND